MAVFFVEQSDNDFKAFVSARSEAHARLRAQVLFILFGGVARWSDPITVTSRKNVEPGAPYFRDDMFVECERQLRSLCAAASPDIDDDIARQA